MIGLLFNILKFFFYLPREYKKYHLPNNIDVLMKIIIMIIIFIVFFIQVFIVNLTMEKLYICCYYYCDLLDGV